MNKHFKKLLSASVLLLGTTLLMAQNQGITKGAQAITQATSDIKSYFAPVTNLIYVIAAIVGIFGGFKIYNKMQAGDQDVIKSAIGWFGSAIFLLSIAAILQAFFF